MSAFARLVWQTPLVPAPALGAKVALKLESLQRGGSFKLRGAFMKLDGLDAASRARGVICASAGNHGLGLALAARELGITVQVVVHSARCGASCAPFRLARPATTATWP